MQSGDKSLKIIVHSAKLDRDVATFSTMDPYVQLKIDKKPKAEVHQTKVAKNGGKTP
jgi:hypothetical protein